jgi:hypothetical protein
MEFHVDGKIEYDREKPGISVQCEFCAGLYFILRMPSETFTFSA